MKSNTRKVGRSKNALRARQSINLEALEQRTLLTGQFAGFGTELASYLLTAQTKIISDTAFTHALPIIGSSFGDASKKAAIFTDLVQKAQTLSSTGADSQNNTTDLAKQITGIFGSSVVATPLPDGHSLHLTMTTSSTVQVQGFSTGLKILNISSSNGFAITASEAIDVTIGKDSQGYYIDTDGTQKEFRIAITVPASAVPTIQGRFGSFYLNASQQGSSDLLDVNCDINVTLGKVYSLSALTATASFWGSANANYAVDLSFADPSSTGLNPHLESSLLLNWDFGTEQAPTDPSSDISHFGSAPTATFSNVSFDVGTFLHDAMSPLIDKITTQLAPVFTFAKQLNSPIPALKKVSDEIGSFKDSVKELAQLSGSVDSSPILGTISTLLSNPSYAGLIQAYIDLSSDFTPEERTAVRSVLDLFKKLDQFGNVADLLSGQAALVLNAGSYTIGGTTNDLRTETQSLAALDFTSSAPTSSLLVQVGSLYKTLNDNGFTLPVLESPDHLFRLLLGDTSQVFIKYDESFNMDTAIVSKTLYSQNFLIWVIPCQFLVSLNLSQVSFHPQFGIDATGLQTGKVQDGIFTVSDPNVFVFQGDVRADFTAGGKYDVVEVRAGIEGKIIGTVNLGIGGTPGDHVHLNQLTHCAIVATGTIGTIGYDIGLFYNIDANFNINSLVNLMRDFFAKAGDYLKDSPLKQQLADIKNKLVQTGTALGEQIDQLGANASAVRDKACNSTPVVKTICDKASGNLALGESSLALSGLGSQASLLHNTLWQMTLGQCDASMPNGAANAVATFVPVLAGQQGTVLTLYVGPKAALRNIEPDVIDEIFTVSPADPKSPTNGSVIVFAFGYSQQFNGVTLVFADAGAGNDTIDVSGTGVSVDILGGEGNDILLAGDKGGTIDGGNGNNTITGGNGDDTLSSGDGNDTIIGGLGNDSITGGNGNNTIAGDFRQGSPDDISPRTGFTFDDTITCGSGSDDIYGGPGDDTIDAGAGKDKVDGGSGNDIVSGGTGDDYLIGGSGDDTLNGGAGTDYLKGGDGNDTLTCGLLTDVTLDIADGNTGDDVIYGTAGDNNITGGDGNDVIFGYDGIDLISGGAGNDVIYGGEGNDLIFGDGGTDTLYGQDGSDSFLWLASDGTDRVEGGEGQNTIVMIGTTDQPNSFTVSSVGTLVQAALAGTAGASEIVSTADIQIFSLVGSGQSDTFEIGSLDHTPVQVVEVGTKNAPTDTQSPNQADTVIVHGSNAADSVTVTKVGNSQTNVEGLSAKLVVEGLALSDVLNLKMGAGNDSVRVYGEPSDGSVAVPMQFQIEGGLGNDTLEYVTPSTGPVGDKVILMGNQGNDTLTGGDGPATLLGGAGSDTIIGGAGNDTIYGDGEATGVGANFMILTVDPVGGGNDTIFGGAGNDTIYGGAGNDKIDGGDGDDTIYGFAGYDNIQGGAGNDTIDGGDGNDQIDGGAGDDTIYGSAGTDNIQGGAGNDTIDGGDGNDQIDGGAGDDTIYGSAGTDNIQGGAGNDTIDGGDGNDVLFGGAGNDLITGGAGDDQIWGDDGNDLLQGGTGNDLMIGGAGNDSLQGGDGNDVLFGGADNDVLQGEAGNDALYGGAGNDWLYGGTRDTSTIVTRKYPPATPSDGDDLLSGGGGRDHLDGGNGNNLMDAGNDNIQEVLYAGPGNDYVFTHKQVCKPGQRDIAVIDGGRNHVDQKVPGGITEPAIPTETGERVVFVTPALPTRQKNPIQPGHVLKASVSAGSTVNTAMVATTTTPAKSNAKAPVVKIVKAQAKVGQSPISNHLALVHQVSRRAKVTPVASGR